MFYIYDTKERRTVTKCMKLRCNAEKIAYSTNIKQCGIDEVEKPQNQRRFIVKES